MIYTVSKKYRTVENGKVKGDWIYHDLLKTHNQSEAYNYIKTCPADQEHEFYVIRSNLQFGFAN